MDGGLNGLWRIARASAIGTSHIDSGTPCQDSATHEILQTNGTHVLSIIVSDGAGTAACAEQASALTAQTFSKLIRDFFDAGGVVDSISREIVTAWLVATRDALSTAAAVADRDIREFSCTLLAAIMGENSNVFVQIGDGAIVVSEGTDEGWAWVFWPQHGEFANTTNFVVSSNATNVMEFALTPHRIDEVAVFSDGIENLVLNVATRAVHAPFFDAMFPPVRQQPPGFAQSLSLDLEKYLLSPLICDRTDDDKTLVLATRRAAAPVQEISNERST
jgi:hypothetical protein